jgi:anti-sigma regulatory factor (Ser/Thr protein kinase)
LPKTEQIALHAELGELERLHNWLEAVCQTHQLSERVSFQLDLCLTELVTNVIHYAYPPGRAPDEAVLVQLVHTAREVLVEMTDRGVEFDPVAYVPKAPAATLEEAEVGGRGLLLVHRFASRLRYRREDGCNRLSFIFPASGEPGVLA